MLKVKTLSRVRSAGYVLVGMAVGSILPFLLMPQLQFFVSVSDFRYVGKPLLLILPLVYALGGIYLISIEIDARSRIRRLIGLDLLVVGVFVFVMRIAIMFFLRNVTDVQFFYSHTTPYKVVQFMSCIAIAAVVCGCLLLWSSRRLQNE